MAEIILHHEGAYNLYDSISDGARFVSALTLDQLESFIRTQYGEKGMETFTRRVERAHTTGTSSWGDSLEKVICINRAGPKETRLTLDEFIAQYLTLPGKNDATA